MCVEIARNEKRREKADQAKADTNRKMRNERTRQKAEKRHTVVFKQTVYYEMGSTDITMRNLCFLYRGLVHPVSSFAFLRTKETLI